MFSTLLNADDDWQESLRATWYPRLHPYLVNVGGYGVGNVSENQYTGKVEINEDALEELLVDLGFERNPIACYKTTEDGRGSEGSWVLLSHNDPGDFVKDGYQLHVTLFERRDGEAGRELYAHHEPDWRQSPIKHLYPAKFPGVTWDTDKAAEYTEQLLNERTYVRLRS